MKNKFLITLFVWFSSAVLMNAQDLQYSQFNSMPLALNPAFTGNSYCNYRVSTIYRNQWMGSKDFKAYQSASVGADFNIGRSSNELNNLWGFGVLANYDKTPTNTFSNHSLLLSLAYHLRFGKDANSFLSFGLQGGLAQRTLGDGKYIFANSIDNYGKPVLPSGENFLNESIVYPDMNFGAMVTTNPDPSLNIYGGVSVFHLTQPNISLTNQNFKLPTRLNLHAGAQKYLGNLVILPSAFFQFQQVMNWNAGTYIGTTIAPETETASPIIGYLGLWYKSNDAIAAAARIDLAQFSFVFSYDLHTGGVANSQGSIGSPEISINYFGCFGRNTRRIGCPSL